MRQAPSKSWDPLRGSDIGPADCVTLRWAAGAESDMWADSVLSVVLQIESSPELVRVSHEHEHEHGDAKGGAHGGCAHGHDSSTHPSG